MLSPASNVLSRIRPYTVAICLVRLEERIGFASSDPYLSCSSPLMVLPGRGRHGVRKALDAAERELGARTALSGCAHADSGVCVCVCVCVCVHGSAVCPEHPCSTCVVQHMSYKRV